MQNLFNKVAVCGDLHLGLKSNSPIHNQDCEEFIDWFIETAQKENCETGIFLGDWAHNRNNINLVTLDVSIRCLEKLGQAFTQFFWLAGNHDNFFKDKRDIHSTMFGRFIPGITVVDHPITRNNVTLCPWLIGNEWKSISKKTSKYIFGHFELPHFFMNSVVTMPNHGELQIESFKNYEYGFSGHFHKRQHKFNMYYIGNCFPHNYADAGDTDRGMMTLEWDKEPIFINWPDQPTFHILKLSYLLENADTILKPKQYLRVNLDIDISFEEANFIKEQFVEQYQLRELVLIPEKDQFDTNSETEIQAFESIEKIVSDQILCIDSAQYNKNKLLGIYHNL